MSDKLVKIKYNGKEFYIAANIEYQGIKYFYIIENVYKPNLDLDNLKEDLNIEVNFIYKLPDGKYQNVVDDELFAKLSKKVNLDYIAGMNQFVSLEDEV